MDGLLADLTTSQFVGWQAFAEIEPFGFPAAERRFVAMATICGQGRVKPDAVRYKRRSGSAGRFMSRREISDMLKRQYGS